MSEPQGPPDGRKPPAPSKSQRKRESRQRFELGCALVELPESELRALPLEPVVLEAVLFARSIRSHVARKRQLGYLGGLLRKADVGPLLEALEASRHEARQATARLHRVERWRDALVTGGDEVLTTLIDQRQGARAQTLRQLILSARREQSQDRPPAAARRLFKLLRQMDEDSPLPPPPNGF